MPMCPLVPLVQKGDGYPTPFYEDDYRRECGEGCAWYTPQGCAMKVLSCSAAQISKALWALVKKGDTSDAEKRA